MLIVQLDEPVLFVFSSPQEVTREIEAADAENLFRAAFDEHGVPYQVNWKKPNRYKELLFGVVTFVEGGEYELVPAGPPAPASLVALLEAHPGTPHPPSAKPQLDALLRTLRAV